MTAPYPINVNIPNAPNNPADDQPIMKQNYANISGFLAVDHSAPGTATTAGIHNQVRLINQTSSNFAPGAGVLYAKLDVNNHSQPFWKNALLDLPIFGNATYAANGSINIGGLIINWGSVTLTNKNQNGTVSFTQANTNNTFGILTSFVPADGTITASNGTVGAKPRSSAPLAQFTYVANQADFTNYPSFFWVALGN